MQRRVGAKLGENNLCRIANGWRGELRQMLMQRSEQDIACLSQSTAEDDPVRVQNADDGQQTARKPTSSFPHDVKRSRVALGGRLHDFLGRNTLGPSTARIAIAGEAIPAAPSPLLASLRYS